MPLSPSYTSLLLSAPLPSDDDEDDYHDSYINNSTYPSSYSKDINIISPSPAYQHNKCKRVDLFEQDEGDDHPLLLSVLDPPLLSMVISGGSSSSKDSTTSHNNNNSHSNSISIMSPSQEDQEEDLVELETQEPLPLPLLDTQEAGGAPALPAPKPLESSLTQDMRMEQTEDDDEDYEEEDEDDDGYATALTSNTEAASNVSTSSQKNKEAAQRCLMDFCEWWCYTVITSETTAEIKSADSELNRAMKNLCQSTSSSLTSAEKRPQFGRLASRILLAGVAYSLAMMVEDAKAALNNNSSSTLDDDAENQESSVHVEDHWKLLGEELILLKSNMLRQDANLDVLPYSTSAKENAAPNHDLEQHVLFQKHFHTTLQRIQVQQHLTVFYRQLKHITSHNSNSACTTVAATEATKRQIQQAIDQYEQHIHAVFASSATTTTTSADDQTSVQSAGSDVRQLPRELVGFLLKDMYQAASSSTANNNNANANTNNRSLVVAHRLLHHVQSILFASNNNNPSTTTTTTPTASQSPPPTVPQKYKYSIAATQQAIRHLLCAWQDLVLEEPTLVKLGYGPAKDNGGVVSLKRQQAEAEEDAMLRRLSNPVNVNVNVNDIRAAACTTTATTMGDATNINRRDNMVVDSPLSDNEQEDDDDVQDGQQQDNTDKGQQEVVWIDSTSSSSDDDDSNQQQQSHKRPLERIAKDEEEDAAIFRPRKKTIMAPNSFSTPSTRRRPDQNDAATKRRRNVTKNQQPSSPTQSESDSEPEANLLSRRQRPRHEHQHGQDDDVQDDDSSSNDSNNNNNTDMAPSNMTEDVMEVIRRGVTKYGLGRWHVIQINDKTGLLEEFDAQEIKQAYYHYIKK